MIESKRLRTERWSILALAIGMVFIFISSRRPVHHYDVPTILIAPPKHAKFFALGYHETAADILWIRVIQDFDVCEQTKAELAPVPLPAFLGGKATAPHQARCSEGWVYRMLDTVTELAPGFKTAYTDGGTMLSILVDDSNGAYKILKKGTERFPDDWELHYFLGYHTLYHLHDSKKAAEHVLTAAKLGAPDWTFALAGRLYSKAGQGELGLSVLQSALARDPEGPLAPRLKERIAEIQREMREP